MKMKREQKRILLLVVAFGMLISAMESEAAAEPIQQDTQPAVTVDAELELSPIMAVEGNEEAEEGTGPEAQEETTEKAEEESKEKTEEKAEEKAEEESKEKTEEKAEEESKEKTEEKTEEESEEKTEEAESKIEAEAKEESEEDCLVTEGSEKAGHGEHNYDDQGVCMDCGYAETDFVRLHVSAEDGMAVVAEGDIPTYKEAYEAMIALKEKYPEGTTWTNYEPYGSNGQLGSAYTWKGGAIYGANSGVGCMAFVFILSDEAFGSLPARAIQKDSFTFEDVAVGDILRINGNSHSVIVLQKSAGGVTVAEGNYNKSVHWGRAMSAAEVEKADFIITRYPEGYVPWDADDPAAGELVGEGMLGSLNWSVTKAGVLTISGSGAIPVYSADTPPPWSELDFSTIVIEEGVTGIGDYAFYESGALSVYLPDSVTAIGQNAFYGSALLAVTIPGSVRTIGSSAFRNCENLTSATVSDGVTAIGDNAFRGCTALTYIDFPASITLVGAEAFKSCSEMVSVRFMPGSGAVKMGDELFAQCWKLTRVTLPQTADRITAGMFASCTSLPELYIPASVTAIGDDVTSESPFNSCQYLKVIYFGGSEAEWNSMMNPYLLASLKSIGATIVFNAEFDNPFAGDPNDPGDFQPGESESCTDHVDADNDGKCDNCGKSMPADSPGSDNNEDRTDTDDGEKNPAGSGGSYVPPATDSSENSSGSSDKDGASYTDNTSKVPPERHKHDYSSTVTKEASCTEAGIRTYICSCGNSYTESIPMPGHSYQSRVTTEPTISAEGEETYICTRCGDSYTKTLQKLKNTSAETGSRPESGKPFIEGEPGREGWEVIREQTDKAEDGSNINVDMNGSAIVPGNVLENIRGRDITVVFNMGNGILWSVNGKSVGEGEIRDIDFSVQTGTEMIPVNAMSMVKAERYCTQISLAYEGEFGFTAVLSIDLGKENAECTASLYYYNENTGELEFICADTVAEDGRAAFAFTHASDYVIAIDREQEESPQSGRPWEPWWFIAAGSLVLIIGIASFFVIRRKKEGK